MQAVLIPPQVPLGKIKSFGLFGEEYEVVKPLRQLDDGDWMYEIKLVKTGESAEYRLTHINDDPLAKLCFPCYLQEVSFHLPESKTKLGGYWIPR